MRNIITLTVLLLMMVTASYGAVSDDVYVRKDVFDVHMQSINAKFDVLLEQMKESREEMKSMRADLTELTRVASVMSGRIDRNFEILSGRIDGLDKRMDDQQHYLYLVPVLLGIIVALPAVQKMLHWNEERKDSRKTFITLEDVTRLIEENNAKLLKTLQVYKKSPV